MPSYIRPHVEGLSCLRALMQSALPLLIKTSASEAVSQTRVWGSRSDLSWHHRCHAPRIRTEETYIIAITRRGEWLSPSPCRSDHCSAAPKQYAHSCWPGPLRSCSSHAVPGALGPTYCVDRS